MRETRKRENIIVSNRVNTFKIW